MAIAKYTKAATDRKRYQIDYTDWLDTGETLAGVVFTVDANSVQSPLVVNDVQVLPSGLGVQYYVSGGLDGVTYRILANATTSPAAPIGSQIKLDEILMTIREP